MNYSELLKLCEQCNYKLEINSGNDERFISVLDDCECDCCGKRGKVYVLDLSKRDTKLYKKYLRS